MAEHKLWIAVIGSFLLVTKAYAQSQSPTRDPTVFNPSRFDVLKSQVQCDFETSETCTWSHSSQVPLKWMRISQNTPSDDTGPEFDHTKGQGADGNYLYLESSAPSKQNEIAMLVSPELLPFNNDPVCFSFWYHMFGANVGTLEVKQVHKNTVTLFNQTGNQGDQWQHASVTINPPGPLTVKVLAYVGDGYQGDIAIDDFTLKDGKC